MSTPAAQRRRLRGVVVSAKGQRTCIIRIDWTKTHPKYGKQYVRSKRLAVHDPDSRAKEGMMVEVEECRPLSRTKRWKLHNVIE